jgi:hypothetical protein
MKSKTMILSAALLMVIASISCSLFTGGKEPTREAEPCCLSTPSGPLKFKPDILPSAQVGVRYESEIQITQNSTPAGEISISNGVLPAGLEFVKVEGEDSAKISGIPEETGTFTFTVYVWCYGTMVSGQTGEKEYKIVVQQ